jgi:hypothetical protein
MLKIVNGFIGYPTTGDNHFFVGCDSEKEFLKNLSKKPDDWYYRNKPITYKRNSLGHRCAEPEDIKLENYILFTGCSHTEGVGLALEDTYSYLVSKELGYDYYNLGIGGTGTDTMMRNLLLWLATKEKPKYIVLQWPSPYRFLLKLGSDHVISHGSWSKEKGITDFIIAGDNINYFRDSYYLSKNLIENITDIPIINLFTPEYGLDIEDPYHIPIERIDEARDTVHNGVLSQQYLRDKIVHTINLLNK